MNHTHTYIPGTQPKDMPHIAGGGHHPITKSELEKLINDARLLVDARRMDYYVSRCYLLRVAQAVPGYVAPNDGPMASHVVLNVDNAKLMFTQVVFDCAAVAVRSELEALLGIDLSGQGALALGAAFERDEPRQAGDNEYADRELAAHIAGGDL